MVRTLGGVTKNSASVARFSRCLSSRISRSCSSLLIGLELGADDYLTTPFSPRELVARVRAVFRRTAPGAAAGDVIRAGGVALDLPWMQARIGKRAIELTATEFELLATLMRQPGALPLQKEPTDIVALAYAGGRAGCRDR